jgi:F-type H+-transporting ATPase subunit b
VPATAIATDGAILAAQAAFPPFETATFPSQLFWFAISFGVLYFLLSRWMLPRIGSAIEERRDRVADDLDAAAQMKAQSDEAVRTYEKSLADARAKAQSVAANARAEMERQIAEDTAQVDAELAKKSEAAEARIAESKAKALSEVRVIAASAAADVAQHLAGVDVTEADAAAAVDAKA